MDGKQRPISGMSQRKNVICRLAESNVDGMSKHRQWKHYEAAIRSLPVFVDEIEFILGPVANTVRNSLEKWWRTFSFPSVREGLYVIVVRVFKRYSNR